MINIDVEGTSRSQPTLNQETSSRSTPWDVSLPERCLQPLRNCLDEEKLNVVLDLSRNVVVDIFPIRPRKDHLLHTSSVGSQDLFFDPAYGFDATAEGDLEVDELRGCAKMLKELYYLSGHGDVNRYT